MQKITPFLWFDSQAEEAAKFYLSVFKNSKITAVSRYGDAGPGPAISLFVSCKTQKEVDDLWERLSAGGEKNRCGWLQDKDPKKAKNTMQAMLQMDKLDIKALEQAHG